MFRMMHLLSAVRRRRSLLRSFSLGRFDPYWIAHQFVHVLLTSAAAFVVTEEGSVVPTAAHSIESGMRASLTDLNQIRLIVE